MMIVVPNYLTKYVNYQNTILTSANYQFSKIFGKNLIPYLTSYVRLVELGSGSSTKTRLLVDALFQSQEAC